MAGYLRDTQLATPKDGEMAVENLAIGDLVATLDGPMPIKWIGRRSYLGHFTRGNKAVLPVCISAGALADGVPCRDLWVSPKHALLLDGTLIPAGVLVNGTSIVQAREVEAMEYFHIELDRHGILIAEGVLAESFVDDNCRGIFHNAHEHAALYPDASRVPALYCAPRRKDGEQVEAVRRCLARHAGPAVPSGYQKFGALHGCVDLIEAMRVYGWAQNMGQPEVPVCLEVLLGGKVVACTLANRYRKDLWRVGLGSGRHAFEVALPDTSSGIGNRLVRVRRAADGVELLKWLCPATGRPYRHSPEQAP